MKIIQLKSGLLKTVMALLVIAICWRPWRIGTMMGTRTPGIGWEKISTRSILRLKKSMPGCDGSRCDREAE